MQRWEYNLCMEIPEHIKRIIETAEAKAFSTWSGKEVNVIPVSSIRIVNNQIWLINYFFNKTLKNIQKYPACALACWKGFEGVQIKGNLKYETKGDLFEEAVTWVKSMLPDRVVKGVVVISPTEIFDLTPSVHESGKSIISSNNKKMSLVNVTKRELGFCIGTVVVSVFLSLFVSHLFNKETIQETEQRLIKAYYETENLVNVSPHGMRLKMDAGEFNAILVDLRSQEEYELGHITGAVNIPAYKDKNTPDYGAVERIIESFKLIPKEKEIITYCYSSACMTSRKIGKMLAEHGIYVKHLNIGWNEWKNDWTSWNHQHEWFSTWPYQYITAGKEPGEIKVRKENVENAGCPVNGFGC